MSFFEDADCSHLIDNKKHGRYCFFEIDNINIVQLTNTAKYLRKLF